MALPSTYVWEIRSAGSINNGGAFVSGGSGTDRSQQNSPQYALTSVTTAGADAILLHASASSDMVDNGVKIVSGTNFTVGWYRIVSVVVGVSITLDRTCTTAAGASGVVNVGGAIAAINNISSVAVAGNILWMKGSFTLAASDGFTASGTSTNPIQIIGYNSTRGDGYLGRTNGNGALITTNFAALAYNSTFKLTLTGSWVLLSCLNITGSINSNSVISVDAQTVVRSCRIVNASTTSAYGLIGNNSNVHLIDSDVSLSGASGGLYAVYMVDAGGRTIGCRITTVNGIGILTASTGNISRSLIYNCGGVGIQSNATSGSEFIGGNTIVGCTGDGIDLPASSTALRTITNNVITDNGGYGIDCNNTATAIVQFNNRFRDNTSGSINSGTGYVNATGWNNVTADGGAGLSDYTSPGSFDYTLRPQSPAALTGLIYPNSIGAYALVPQSDPPSRYRRQP